MRFDIKPTLDIILILSILFIAPASAVSSYAGFVGENVSNVPLEGVSVQLSNLTDNLTQLTDVDGYFYHTNLSGEYNVTVALQPTHYDLLSNTSFYWIGYHYITKKPTGTITGCVHWGDISVCYHENKIIWFITVVGSQTYTFSGW